MEALCDIKTDIENLSVTDKAVREIQYSSNQLSLRERQLLIMLISDKSICEGNPYTHGSYCSVCEGLVSKVDLGSLVDRGYLQLQSGTFLHTAMHTKPKQSKPAQYSGSTIKHNLKSSDLDTNTQTQANDPNRVEPEVFLRIASGNF